MPLILPNTIDPDTTADAVEIEQNNGVIEQYVNTNVITRDGAVAMQQPLLLAGDPTQPNQAANKAYVDARTPPIVPPARVACHVRRTGSPAIPTGTNAHITWDTEVEDTHGFITLPDPTIRVPAGQGGTYAISSDGYFDTGWQLGVTGGMNVLLHGYYIALGGRLWVEMFHPAFAWFSISVTMPIAAGTEIKAFLRQDSGVSRTLTDAELWIERLDGR